MAGRAQRRDEYTPDQRIGRLEEDADLFELAVAKIRDDHEREVADLRRELARVKGLALSILISVMTILVGALVAVAFAVTAWEEFFDKPWVLRGIVTLAIMSMIISFGLALFLPQILDNTDGSRTEGKISACRAGYNADVQLGVVRLLAAMGDEDDAVGAAAVAAIRQDPTSLALVAAQIETAAKERQAAVADLLEASAAYDDAVMRSTLDPDQFLADCKKGITR